MKYLKYFTTVKVFLAYKKTNALKKLGFRSTELSKSELYVLQFGMFFLSCYRSIKLLSKNVCAFSCQINK